MKWVTPERPKTDRIACAWLIRRFIDPTAEIVYVPAGEVLEVAEREGGRSLDIPGATFTHRDGRCTFEALVEEFHLAGGCFVYDALYAWCKREVTLASPDSAISA